jgi:hypothetical protein
MTATEFNDKLAAFGRRQAQRAAALRDGAAALRERLKGAEGRDERTRQFLEVDARDKEAEAVRCEERARTAEAGQLLIRDVEAGDFDWSREAHGLISAAHDQALIATEPAK